MEDRHLGAGARLEVSIHHVVSSGIGGQATCRGYRWITCVVFEQDRWPSDLWRYRWITCVVFERDR